MSELEDQANRNTAHACAEIKSKSTLLLCIPTNNNVESTNVKGYFSGADVVRPKVRLQAVPSDRTETSPIAEESTE